MADAAAVRLALVGWSTCKPAWVLALTTGNRRCLRRREFIGGRRLEILGVQSWVARNCIDIPNDDQFIRWRHFNSDDESAVKAMEMAERELGVETALNQAMKAADQYGTGVVVIMSGEDMLDVPLDLNRIREGDVTALHYFRPVRYHRLRIATMIFIRRTLANLNGTGFTLPMRRVRSPFTVPAYCGLMAYALRPKADSPFTTRISACRYWCR